MAKRARTSNGRELELASQKVAAERYVLRLYVTGMTSRSIRAIENVRAISIFQ